MKNYSTDMLIVSVPVLDLQYPPSSPSVMKGCLENAGYKAQTLDLNILLWQMCNEDDRIFIKEQYQFESPEIGDPSTDNEVDWIFNEPSAILHDWALESIKRIQAVNAKWLGISTFSYKSHKAVLLLCTLIRKYIPDIKIVLGGRGVESFITGPDYVTIVEKLRRRFGHYLDGENFANVMLDYKLTDRVITGDAETEVLNLMQGGTPIIFKGDIKSINLGELPFVNFDDYDLDAYQYVNNPILPITGSKGCVRKCSFCDIPIMWPSFRFRTGEHIAKEMIHLQSRHGVSKFYLTDSLVNGSLKAFTDFIKTLSEYNNKTTNKITWVGQYITRKASIRLDDTYYRMLKDSGAEGLTIGVESGSNNVRKHMKKQFTTDDIYTELEYFNKYGISCVLLFFSCYPTETWQDFLDTVDMLIKFQRYCASGTIYKITLGTPYTHHRDTPLYNIQDDIGLDIVENSDILWLLKDNKDLTYYERMRRRLILQEVSTILKLPMSRNTPELTQIISTYKYHNEVVREFFGDMPDFHIYKDVHDQSNFSSLLMPLEVQEQIYIENNQHNIDVILSKHSYITDDIKFDSELYNNIKDVLINRTYYTTNNEEHSAMNNLPNDTFCVLPWVSLEATPIGTVRPCCLSDELHDDYGKKYNLNFVKLKDVQNGKHLTNIRKQFLAGKRPEMCEKCWAVEDSGGISKRIYTQRRLQQILKSEFTWDEQAKNLYFLDLKLGTICNIKCRICGSWSSSKFAGEELKFETGPIRDSFHYEMTKKGRWPRTTNTFWQELVELADGIKYLEFTGGEPFLIKEHFKYLQTLIDSGHANNIEIHYNTNGTIYEDKFIDLWRNFKHVEIAFSIDNVGKRFELERSLAIWDDVNANIKKFINMRDNNSNIALQLCTTINIYNVLYLHDIVAWEHYKDLDYIYWNILHDAPEHSIRSLPQNAKDKAIEILSKTDHYDAVLQTEFKNIISFIKSEPVVTLNDIINKIEILDSRRKESLEQSHNLLWTLLQEAKNAK